MKYFGLIAAAFFVLLLTIGVYVYHFYGTLNYGVSSDTDAWGQFGDYFGGILNPLLSFIALICLIQSLTLQNQANADLRAELKQTKQHEKLRSFNLLFFNIIEAQKTQIGHLSIKTKIEEASQTISGIDAILHLEKEIETLREGGASDKDIEEYLEEVDFKDCIFGMLRSFYLAAKLVTDRLSDAEGFSLTERSSHFQTLINFTDFSQLRLILIATQFTQGPYAEFLTAHSELKGTLEVVGLRFDLY
ncbi:hypothetical protein [Bordetella pseudohinzii]|uniref:Phage abortive infection protein n=1 Tax=Bordetella pseudohinzii TaxID=1331258 RepID=A0A0M7F5U0_9BORD|nr:hypothetical protein [Bordetella pseudohinzii]CUI76461.1 Uncharacterised protein [Bordetella pseudohinzii]